MNSTQPSTPLGGDLQGPRHASLDDTTGMSPTTQFPTNMKKIGDLPFQTSYEEYDRFISEITARPVSGAEGVETSPRVGDHAYVDPVCFNGHLKNVRLLESRLNYRFLELESKLRFLRLLAAGTDLKQDDLALIEADSEAMSQQVESLEAQVEELKKIGKSLRKKIGKCVQQAEIRRCIEGKPILQDEINTMMHEIAEAREFFKENGLFDEPGLELLEWAKMFVNENLLGAELLVNNIDKLKKETRILKEELTRVEGKIVSMEEQEKTLDEEIGRLQAEKEALEKHLSQLDQTEASDNDMRLSNEYSAITKLVETWETF
ncbi:hypothetical protein JL09_g815 [Pichia kudriavzevii]|uniref:Uncharacterized protein n=1 Tax=Pichia kudriavzevii TaxID=4909 RepID=A0A099P7X1_PICKU|nr:hypothetical protein JL09_g815 [Pichia kudriavzevii]